MTDHMPAANAATGDLQGWGTLEALAAGVDDAFTPEVDGEIARRLESLV